MKRNYSLADNILINLEQGLATLLGNPMGSGRANPTARENADTDLNDQEKTYSARLMRINHAGEIAAQALYQGQSLTAQSPEVKAKMRQSAIEENDHLIWCKQRLNELDSHTSYLAPLWYSGSFALGAIAGLAGDKWSLGFVVETEKQVAKHLENHLDQLSAKDKRSRAILEQMKIDELHHATVALEAGASELPKPIKKLMSLTSKVMTKTAYWI